MNELQEWKRIPITQLRDQVIEDLKNGYAHDHLAEAEFERRLDQATAAESKGELMALVADLPDLPSEGSRSGPGHVLNTGNVRQEQSFVAILGGAERKGVWRPARHNKILTFMGGVELDFSEAELAPGVTTIDVMAAMGGVEITVSEDIRVEMEGFPILGGFEDKSNFTSGPDAPVLRIRGVVIMGGVEVKMPKRRRRRG